MRSGLHSVHYAELVVWQLALEVRLRNLVHKIKPRVSGVVGHNNIGVIYSMIEVFRKLCPVQRKAGLQEKTRSRFFLFPIATLVVVAGIVSGGCATGNFHWYSPPGAETPSAAHHYAGDSPYASQYLLRRNMNADDPLLLSIDDSIQIHASDLLSRFEQSYLLRLGGTISWEQVADTLEYMLLDTLVSLAADTFQLQQDAAGWGDLSLVSDASLGRVFLEEIIYAQTEVDSLEADSFYFARPDIFTYFAQVNLGHIILSKAGYRTGSDPDEYLAMSDKDLDSLIHHRLNVLKKAITDSASFEEFADKYSQDRRTGAQGGRMGWVERYNLHPEVEDVLYDESTPLHEVIGPVDSRDGVHLFYIYDRHFKGVPPMNAARYKQAYNYVLGSHARVVYARVRDSLRAAHPSTFNDSALALKPNRTHWETPVAWADGIDTVRFETYDRARSMVRSKIPVSTVLSVEVLRSIAQEAIDARLTLLMARDHGLDDNVAYQEEVERERQNFSRAAIHRKSRDPNYRPTDREVEQYFKEHNSEYRIEKPVRIQQIVFVDSVEAEFVRALAESGEDFLGLAEKYYPGDTAIRRDVADLGYIGPLDFDKKIFSTAIQGNAGDITAPIKTQYGYHVVKILDVKREVSLDEARGPIILELTRIHNEEVNREWYQKLISGHRVTIEPVRYRGIVMGSDQNRLNLSPEILPDDFDESQN